MDGFSTEKSAFCALPMYGQNGNHIIFLAIQVRLWRGHVLARQKKKALAGGLRPLAEGLSLRLNFRIGHAKPPSSFQSFRLTGVLTLCA